MLKKMIINKYWVGGIFCCVLAGCATHAPQGLAEEKSQSEGAALPVDDGMVLIPAGEFTMGSDKEQNAAMWREANALNPYGFRDKLYVDEHPAHKVNLPAYYIDKYEVTNADYREFVISSQHSVPRTWQSNGYAFDKDSLATLPPDHLRQIASDMFKLDMDVSNMSQEALIAELDKIQQQRDKLPVTSVTWPDAD
ncbi:MAG: SUMF1/EgtB/PvdO family nonheme iron enzyme, partial [Nitrosomonadales bacterium]|nr:SUMF1/EgtB/PvdO family nonheme iron enzyme [Nitrosomonadales bacterium]